MGTPAPERGRHQPVKSADRTLEILETLAQLPSRPSLSELSKMLGIPKSSLYGILKTMQHRRWVETDVTGTRFGLGMRALLVGTSYVDTDDVIARTQPTLDRLAEELGETVHLGRLDEANVVYLAKRECVHPLRMFSAVGRRLPAHTTALGKALLSRLSWDEVDSLLPDPLPALTRNTIVDRAALRDDLEATRQRGYAAEREENAEGIRCLAVAFGDRASSGGAISFAIPLLRLTDEMEQHAIKLLQEAKQQLRGLRSIGF